MIKHYSFDLWLTIIKSNPTFKEERAKYFHKKYNPLKRSLAEIKDIIRNVDLCCNSTNEIVGKNIDALEMYCMVLYQIGNDLSDFSATKINEIYSDVAVIFFRYPPTLFDENTLCTLSALHNQGSTLSILSNTGFIKGVTLKQFIQISDLSQITFKFMLFSDEVGLSKPNPYFFDRIQHHLPIKVFKNHILHVGDNPNADGKGAQGAGIPHFIINNTQSSQFTIKHLSDETLFPA